MTCVFTSIAFLLNLLVLCLAVGGCWTQQEIVKGHDTGADTDTDGDSDTDTDTDTDSDTDTDTDTGEEVVCVYGDQIHEASETIKGHWFWGPGNCRCLCTKNEAITCSTIVCQPSEGDTDPYQYQCDYFGTIYDPGEIWACSDGCNGCECATFGLWSQTLVVSELTQCTYDSEIYIQGDNFLSEDGCNWCTCWGEEQVTCTTTWECVAKSRKI